MTFRPSPLAYALAVLVAWLACLAIAFDRAELLFIAVPLVLRLAQSLPPADADIGRFALASDGVAPSEGDVFTLTIDARLTAATGLVQVLPALPGQVGTDFRTAVFSPQPDGRVCWDIPLLCRFGGMLEFDAVFFRQWDRSGLWVGEARRDQSVRLAVRPIALAIRTVPSPRLTGAPFGVHASQKFGDGSDFADIRSFAAGDRMKRINWPVSLRMRQLHVNQFHIERSANVILLIDTFVNIGERPHSTLDFTLRAAAGLAQAYLRQSDRVGLIEVGGWLRWTRPASGPRQYETILRSLTRATVTATDLRRNVPDLPKAMLPRHALIIALTPLTDERFVHVVIGLADQGRDVVLLAIGGDEVSLPYLTRRAGHPVVRRVWRLLREDRLREMRGHGMRAALWVAAAADRGGVGIGGAPRHAQGRMVRLSGIAAVLLIAGVSCLVLPERHVLGAGVVAAAICAGGLLLPSLGLATAGAVLAVLVFSVALLVASSANAVTAAMLMGITVLVLLDATHFHQRFSRSAIMPGVVRAHLGQLGATILVSVLAVGVLAVVSDAFWLGLDAVLRPAVAAAGGILVVLAILRVTTR